jgi:hypothetical protein
MTMLGKTLAVVALAKHLLPRMHIYLIDLDA